MPELPSVKPREALTRIGGRTERNVYNHPNSPFLVLGKEKQPTNPDYMHAYFYFGRILNTMLPDHFPEVHMAQGGTNAQAIAQKVLFDPADKMDGKFRKELQKVRGKLDERGIFHDITENGEGNWGWRNNTIIYLDKVKPINANLYPLILDTASDPITSGFTPEWATQAIRPDDQNYRGGTKYMFDEPTLRSFLSGAEPEERERIERWVERYKFYVDQIPLLPADYKGKGMEDELILPEEEAVLPIK